MDYWVLFPTKKGHTALLMDRIRRVSDDNNGTATIVYDECGNGAMAHVPSTASTEQIFRDLRDQVAFTSERSAKGVPVPLRDYTGFAEEIGVPRPPIEQIKELLRDHGWAVIGSHENDAGVLSFHVFGRTK